MLSELHLWHDAGSNLVAVRTKHGPPMEIVFAFRRMVTRGDRISSEAQRVHVPFPVGREHEWTDAAWRERLPVQEQHRSANPSSEQAPQR